jgi:DNA-binding NtrC family response regulator
MDEPVFKAMRSQGHGSSDLVGSSEQMARLRADIARLAGSSAAVLVQGPTGSGKENVARALHAASARSRAGFVAINCAAIPAELAEAELFGAEAGAYTGIVRARSGRIEQADGGTLFLDEIGDMPLSLQAKLLRVLETGEVTRLGATRSIAVNVRLIAATHVDLEAAVSRGTFRADLYWRLAVLFLDVPSLAERAGDIPALVAHFAARQRQRLHLTACGAEALVQHPWPGNVRELRNLVERALALDERCLDAATVRRLLMPRRRSPEAWLTDRESGQAPVRTGHIALPGKPLAESIALKALLAETEAALIAQALEASGGTVAESARRLGLKRTTLVEKMKRMGLRPPANEAA